MLDVRDVKAAAQGKWRNILPSLGVGQEYLTGRHSPCPCCGGKDRFRFDNKEGRGTYFCNQCGAGNGLDLVMKLNGWNFRHASNEISRVVIGNSTGRESDNHKKIVKRQEYVFTYDNLIREEKRQDVRLQSCSLFNSGVLAYNHPYLMKKEIVADLKVMKVGAWPYYNQGETTLLIGLYDLYYGLEGTLHNIQGIFAKNLNDGSNKRFLPGGGVKGLCCPIGFDGWDNAGELYIAEGVATAMSIHILTGCPALASMSLNNIEPIILLAKKKFPYAHIVIAADDDRKSLDIPYEKNTTLKKVIALANKHQCGWNIPTFTQQQKEALGKGATDWNDWARVNKWGLS
ncbi:DNA primase TraC [Piscirickettsia salmonis]|uniref:primase-helicase zinc-binding domain-containing protein n=1 Tax=Piscirickettsia salmonis TaxID=1238 RepID=UPI0018ACB2B3|nr:primase-helicase zinc-binding domain-containing protein [Piscirickettsia salmonis]QGP53365.1 DNA primase TraC [Piscirickettsia salmonis]QGP60716.1 DNA primase TraC [Piscirickettsia salmonis]QGP62930.1 DNA primase TraC [Piscirickettsia salmonis]